MPIREKIKSPKALQRIVAAAKKSKKQVVFTNGCFDILHRGHVTYLERAKKLGKILIVAMNSDESVQRLKGPERPINRLSDRLEVMAALESIDYVTWFEEDDPVELIRLVKPTILVKGGDWKPKDILGSEDVLGWGGKVFSLPYIQGQSTTQIIARARIKKS
jgi:rfaE bifunctional protein nucleotidyltransferase chain/domain